jgi:hypothetical protein
LPGKTRGSLVACIYQFCSLCRRSVIEKHARARDVAAGVMQAADQPDPRRVSSCRSRAQAHGFGQMKAGRSWAEINPELVREAKRLRRRSPKGGQRSLRDVAAELAKLGFVNERGNPFSASSIASMLEG